METIEFIYKPYLISQLNGGYVWKFKFQSGVGVSVIRHNGSYGGEKGFFELGIEYNGGLTYQFTDITEDVIGWLTIEEVNSYLKLIHDRYGSDFKLTIWKVKKLIVTFVKDLLKIGLKTDQ